VLDEALTLPPDARAAWLHGLPAAAGPVIDTLRRLLALPAAGSSGDLLHTLPKLPPGGADALSAAPAAGALIGPWLLLRQIGEGGMGSVWLAEHADGQLKRQVALKLLRLSWARGLAERLASERNILATLEHPRTARLDDAWVDQLGRPWLALEFVQGQPIDACARGKALTVRQRVALLLQVGEAVACAHARLVIHRDLKPSHILVTDNGQVQLLDFGIAKLVQGNGAPAAAPTDLAGRAMTLDYASPEQVQGQGLGAASDRYSLGVVACELLTGARPYRLKRGSPAELEEAITGIDAPRASDAVADAAVRKALRGDLDAILDKALKKPAGARYATIDAFAQDLGRHLADEPVSAQPDASACRAGKFVQRHRVQTVAAAMSGHPRRRHAAGAAGGHAGHAQRGAAGRW